MTEVELSFDASTLTSFDEALDNPLAYDAYDLEYYVRAFIVIRIGEQHLLPRDSDWPVLFLGRNIGYYLRSLDAHGSKLLDIPEGSFSLLFERLGDQSRVTEVHEGPSGTAPHRELVKAANAFEDDLRAELLRRQPRFVDHPDLGKWFRTPINSPS